MEWQELRSQWLEQYSRWFKGEAKTVDLPALDDLIKTYIENPDAVETVRENLRFTSGPRYCWLFTGIQTRNSLTPFTR